MTSRLLILATALIACMACGGNPPQQERSPAGQASPPSRPPARMPTDTAVAVSMPAGSTSYVWRGKLGAGVDAEFLVGEEKGAVLLAHVMAPEEELTVSVHRADTGVELDDHQENPAFWIARMPETLGYLVIVHSSGKETEYELEIEAPREVRWDAGKEAAELTAWVPANGVAAYVVPESAAFAARLASAPKDAYLTVYTLDGKPLLKASDNQRSFDGALPTTDQAILRVNQGPEAGEFTLQIEQKPGS